MCHLVRHKPYLLFSLFTALLIGLATLTSITNTQATQAAGIIFHVKPAASGNCMSWGSPCDLSTALGAANAGDEVWVAQGVYKPTNYTEAISATFQLQNDVAIYGGFAPDQGADTFEERDWETYVTVLSGDIDNNDTTNADGVITTTLNISGTNAYHVVTNIGITNTAILDGFTITAGMADEGDDGGGMFNDSSSPTLSNIIFTGNRAEENGGGMYNIHSSPILTNVIFESNLASRGGGMRNVDSDPILTNVTFNNNSADSSNGGGMYNTGSNPILTHVTFRKNSSMYPGGGMWNSSGIPILTDVIFDSNTGYGMFNNGNGNPIMTDVIFKDNDGGMWNQNSTPTLIDVTFSDNYNEGGMCNYHSDLILINVTFNNNVSKYGGGGMRNYDSNPTLTKVIFSGNTATEDGGGMSNNSSSNPILTNVTFNGNTAKRGGGLFNTGSNPTLINVTFSGNVAITGGGIYNENNSNPTLINTILWGNKAGTTAQIHNIDSTSVISYSLIEGGCPENGNCDAHLLEVDPHFVDAANGNLRLQGDSPAIDAGNNDVPGLGGIATDLDGRPRFLDTSIPDKGNGTPPIIDLGAYEYDPKLPTYAQLESAPNPAYLGQEIVFTASVTATSGTVDGSVAFYDGETLLGNRNLDIHSAAALTTTTLSEGVHIVSAHYGGKIDFFPSTSTVITQVIRPNDIYLPLALDNYITYFKEAWELEPNNNYLQANGPLVFDQDYYARPDDAKDHFSFYLAKPDTVTIEMSGHTGLGVQMLLYDKIPVAGGEIKRAHDVPYNITCNGTAGWYYLYIYSTGNYNSTSSYTLKVSAPTTTVTDECNQQRREYH